MAQTIIGKIKGISILSLVFMVLIFVMPATVSAETVGMFEVKGGVNGTDYTYSNGMLTILTDTELTISNIDINTASTDKIIVAPNVSANIVLSGVNIAPSYYGWSGFVINNGTGNVKIILDDGTINTIKGANRAAGIEKSGNSGTLEITGEGTLFVTGGTYAAGIGGSEGENTNGIIISGGYITAQGGSSGAGIGGGDQGIGSGITINGGYITAQGGSSGAGIGGGYKGAGSEIIINGGYITAKGGTSGAGIGGGYGESGNKIIIRGGNITTTGGERGAGIGGGYNGTGSEIIIDGGSVKTEGGAYLNQYVNSIGGGYGDNVAIPVNSLGNAVFLRVIANPEREIVEIDGKDYGIYAHSKTDTNIYAYLPGTTDTIKVGSTEYKIEDESDFDVIGGIYGVDYVNIDSGSKLLILSDTALTISNKVEIDTTTNVIEIADGVSANITLNGVNIDVSAIDKVAAFKIADNSTGNVTITLAENTINTLVSGKGCAGIQKNGKNGTLEITGTGTLNAEGGNSGAGIGGGSGGSAYNIIISGGIITAQSNAFGAGIGGGGDGLASNIIISGGVVTAIGTQYGAGIGGGTDASASNITISGGAVTAKSGQFAAGIGGGSSSSASDITISGGTVTVEYYGSGAGIGGGRAVYSYNNDGNGTGIVINGGSVKISPEIKSAILTGGAKKATIPVNAKENGENVYLVTIPNPNREIVTIDGKVYDLKTHSDTDTNLYVYLTAQEHTIKVGSTETKLNGDLDFTITGGTYGIDYIDTMNTLLVLSDAELTISNKPGVSSTTDRIEIANDVSANIILSGVNIDVSGIEGTAAFMIAGNSSGNVKIVLPDGTINTFKSGRCCAGIEKNGSYGTLEITGTGSLDVAGGSMGAGIGGGYESGSSGIIISGGVITSTGGYWGAGIGGSYYAKASNIIISGGSVKAIAGTEAADIGSGRVGNVNYYVEPTADGTNPVYLLEIENASGADVTVDGKDYPDKHFDEDKLYVYLTGDEVHYVKVGREERGYKYIGDKNKFLRVPNVDDFVFIEPGNLAYDGNSKTALVQVKDSISGMGDISITYYDMNNTPVVEPIEVGSYMVKIDVAIGHEFIDITNLTSDKWIFTIRDESAVESFVERMYTVALGREADVAGVNTWVTVLNANTHDGAGIAKEFILGDEFKMRGLTNEQYVDTLYKTFFDREADTEGKALWIAILDSGQTREYVLSNFVNLPEFTLLCERYGIERGVMLENGTAVSPGISQFVKRMYTVVLGREAENDGLYNNVLALVVGSVNAEDIAKNFFTSEEYELKDKDTVAYVSDLYLAFMNREADTDGIKFWVSCIEQQVMTKDEVLSEFAKSEEFKIIATLYGVN